MFLAQNVIFNKLYIFRIFKLQPRRELGTKEDFSPIPCPFYSSNDFNEFTRGTILARPSPSCAYDDVPIFLLHSTPLEQCHDTKDVS